MNNAQVNPIQPERPPINEEMMRGAMRIALAIEALTHQGFVVIGIEYTTRSKPTIQVQSCALCHDLVERGEATYYRSGVAERGHYRTGQFKQGDCRVLWTEQGH